MSNENSISLSQAEVDRLLGIKRNTEEAPKVVFKREIIAKDDEIERLKEIMEDFTTRLRSHFKKIFTEPGIRKIAPSAIEQISRAEFMSFVNTKDFLFLVEICGHELLLKLDSFLFCALAGITFSTGNTSNRFQNETLRIMVAPLIIGNLLRSAGKPKNDVKITPLYELPKLEGLRTLTPGISTTFTWNEGFRSLGVEKIFFQREFLDFLIS